MGTISRRRPRISDAGTTSRGRREDGLVTGDWWVPVQSPDAPVSEISPESIPFSPERVPIATRLRYWLSRYALHTYTQKRKGTAVSARADTISESISPPRHMLRYICCATSGRSNCAAHCLITHRRLDVTVAHTVTHPRHSSSLDQCDLSGHSVRCSVRRQAPGTCRGCHSPLRSPLSGE